MINKKIAILGATSHIAKGLIYNILQNGKYEAALFARNIKATRDFLSAIKYRKPFDLLPLEKFNKGKYEVIINCIGITDPAQIRSSGRSIFAVTEKYDDLILVYLESNPGSLYINFSSGAVYGGDFSKPAGETTKTVLDMNHIGPEDLYRIMKINSEAKHRSCPDLNIVDLRLFAYFSRFIDLDSGYFIAEIIRCLKNRSVFITGPDNMTRDYVHPQDLFLLIKKCVEKHRINDVYDVYSLKPVTKTETLDYFKVKYGLNIAVRDDVKISSATGVKSVYCSVNKKAEDIGYHPKFSSLECIAEESSFILKTADRR